MAWNESFLQNEYRNSVNNTVFFQKLKARFSEHDKYERNAKGQTERFSNNTLKSKSGRFLMDYTRPDYMTQGQIDNLISQHNNVRSNVKPPADEMLRLAWNLDLEESAWEKAQTCSFSWSATRNKYGEYRDKYGENIWIGWGIKVKKLDVSV
uniref:SCP domain-containing protein n=1 Tax=Ciona savignyi TaxID=51511 RepID=H2Z9Z9_CIOSA